MRALKNCYLVLLLCTGCFAPSLGMDALRKRAGKVSRTSGAVSSWKSSTKVADRSPEPTHLQAAPSHQEPIAEETEERDRNEDKTDEPTIPSQQILEKPAEDSPPSPALQEESEDDTTFALSVAQEEPSVVEEERDEELVAQESGKDGAEDSDVPVISDAIFGSLPQPNEEPVFSPSSSVPASVEPRGRDVSDLFAGGGSESPAAVAFAMSSETIAFVNEQVQNMEQRLLERIEELAGVVDEKYDELYGELSGRINGLEVRISEFVDKLYSTEVAIAQQLRQIENSSEAARATAERAMGAVMRLQAAKNGEKPASTQHYPPPLLSEMPEEEEEREALPAPVAILPSVAIDEELSQEKAQVTMPPAAPPPPPPGLFKPGAQAVKQPSAPIPAAPPPPPPAGPAKPRVGKTDSSRVTSGSSTGDARGDLLAAIRAGTTLRRVAPGSATPEPSAGSTANSGETAVGASDEPGNFLADIRKGVKLRKVTPGSGVEPTVASEPSAGSAASSGGASSAGTGDRKGDLFADIRKGVKLRKVTPGSGVAPKAAPEPSEGPAETASVASATTSTGATSVGGALTRSPVLSSAGKLEEQRQKLRQAFGGSDEEEEDDDDEWDDD